MVIEGTSLPAYEVSRHSRVVGNSVRFCSVCRIKSFSNLLPIAANRGVFLTPPNLTASFSFLALARRIRNKFEKSAEEPMQQYPAVAIFIDKFTQFAIITICSWPVVVCVEMDIRYHVVFCEAW